MVATGDTTGQVAGGTFLPGRSPIWTVGADVEVGQHLPVELLAVVCHSAHADHELLHVVGAGQPEQATGVDLQGRRVAKRGIGEADVEPDLVVAGTGLRIDLEAIGRI